MNEHQVTYPNMTLCFTTDRLIIREFHQEDLAQLLTYEKQPGMLQFESGGILPRWQQPIGASDGRDWDVEGRETSPDPLV